MELTLGKKSISCYKKIFDSRFSREETAETVVPDIMPDIAEIMCSDGLVLLRSKESEQGRVSLTGNIDASILYMPDGENCLKKLYLNMPFSASVESPLFSERTRVVTTLKLISIEARILNPRKVFVKACVCVDIKCYEESELTVCDGVDQESRSDVLVRPAQCVVSPVIEVREKTFVLTDEYLIPASRPDFGELLDSRVEFMADDIKTVGNKLIFKGTVQVTMLYMSPENNDIASAAFSTSFSQIIEMEGASEQPDAEVRLMLTGAYFEPLPATSDGKIISCELHMVAQVICSERAELNYISDAFSNNYEMELYREALEMEFTERRVLVRETIRDLYETRTPVREVINSYGVVLTPEVSGRTVTCPVDIFVMYWDDTGKMCSISNRYNAQTVIEIEEGMSISVLDVRCAEVYATSAAGGIDIRAPLDIEIAVISKLQMDVISGIEMSDEPTPASSDRPSVTVVGSGSLDIWELAKKYHSTPDLIAAANALADSEENIRKTLLIPRAR